MTKFVSLVLTKEQEPRIYFDNPTSHIDTAIKRKLPPGSYVEATWTGPGKNSIKIKCDDGRDELYRSCILENFESWDALVSKVLPPGATIQGDLDLSGSKIKKLPNDLKVTGTLLLQGTAIKELPTGLEVGYELNLCGTKITRLPKDLKVKGHLDLSRSKIKEIPKGLKIGGSLFLQQSAIKKLPEGLEVGLSLDLRNTKITKLPKNLKVYGGIYLAKKQKKGSQ